jgi:hypothetical protein
VLRGAQAYGVRLDQLHSHVTRVAFEGDYEDVPTTTAAGQPLARIARGYSGKDDPRRKQLTVSLSVNADGGVPAWYQVGDGHAADTQTYLAHLATVRAHLHLEQPLVVGDSKLITRANCLGFCRAGAPCIGPYSLSEADRTLLRPAWARGAPGHRLDLAPPGATGGWCTRSGSSTPRTVRRIRCGGCSCIAWMTARRCGTSAPRSWRVPAAPSGRSGAACAIPPTATWRWCGARRPKRSPAWPPSCRSASPPAPKLSWQLDHARLREEAQYDGLYSLLTNLRWRQAQTRTIFRHYKAQAVVEGRFKTFKHPPLQVRPLWLHQQARLESLVFVVLVALFLFAFIEREARREVQQSGQAFVGLRAEGRDHLPVTSTQLLAAFAPLSLVKQHLRVGDEVVEVRTPTTLTPIQAQILQRPQLPPPAVYLQPSITPYPW